MKRFHHTLLPILILAFSIVLTVAMDAPIFNMMPDAGTITNLRQGESFTVSVDFYLDGITTTSGANDGVDCVLWWDGADSISDGVWDATLMTEIADAPDGESDRHSITLDTSDLETGYYGFTTRCDYEGQQYWFGDYHSTADATLALESPIAPATPIFRMRPEPGSLTFRQPQDTEPLTISVDFYVLGVTDSQGQADDVTCIVWSDLSDGVKNNDWGAIAMTYTGDAIQNLVDRYEVEIDISQLAEESYGFTTRCDYDGIPYWFNDHNPDAGGDGTLIITNEDPEEILSRPQEVEGVDWVGGLFPRGGVANVFEQGTDAVIDYYVQAFETGVTEAAGQGADIECFLTWGLFGTEPTTIPMTYNVDIENNDEYTASIDIINTLAPGNYAVDAYCSLAGDDTQSSTVDDLSRPINEGASIITILPASNPPPGTVFVHLFEWKWTDIASECAYLADVGYSAVQVSPPQEHIIIDSVETDAWWTRYQPVSYTLESRSGTQAEFAAMVESCNQVGVDIYVDAVINHMSGQNTPILPGTAGTVYSHYNYPGLYDSSDFHDCGTGSNDIGNYQRRFEVQNCELLNLADLRTETEEVQTEIRTYLQNLLDMGVAGFRIDASKHIPANDLTAIISGLDGDYYIFQEVIGSPTEPVLPQEYVINGDVTEFGYSFRIGQAFNCSNLASLETITNNLLRTDDAVVFVDNHDNQRGHGAGGVCILDHTDGDARYNLGNIFMLAHPYGYPKVMSSYWWDDGTAGADNNPPPTALVYSNGEVTGCNDTDWVCEHRRESITNMVNFRSVTNGEPLTDWQTISPNQIAFGRGASGFVALNAEDSPLTNHTFQTSLPAGDYCDILSGGIASDGSACVGNIITVNEDSTISNATVPATGAFAIHNDSRLVGE